jgi:hypothetical protein
LLRVRDLIGRQQQEVGDGGRTVPGGNPEERPAAPVAQEEQEEQGEPAEPIMPVAPFPTFESVPTLPQQSPGNGYQSGRDSRAR